MIVRLPPDRHREAVALWHAADLTRPWNDPDADLRRAAAGPASTVLAAPRQDTVVLGRRIDVDREHS